MSSVMGSAFSVIPGSRGATEFVSNIIGKVFMSGEHTHNSHSPQATSIADRDWQAARIELVKKFPAVLAVVGDAWYFASHGLKPRAPVGEPRTLCGLVMQLLGPIAKTHPQVLLVSLDEISFWLRFYIARKNLEFFSFCNTCHWSYEANLLLKRYASFRGPCF